MDDILEIDTVFKHVQQATRRLRLSSGTAITQQILLLGDAFYGYRFHAADFTAVWAAADQTLKVFDADGRALESFSISEIADETSDEPNSALPQRRAA